MKKLNLNLIGQDGNAYALLAHFKRQAKRAGWTTEAIEKTIKEATSGDYNHLLSTLIDC